MIIANGWLEVRWTEGGGIDPETGYAVKAEERCGLPVACQWQHEKYNWLSRENGEAVTQQGYKIWVEDCLFEGERVRLLDLEGREIGEFSVKEVERLEAVQETVIWV